MIEKRLGKIDFVEFGSMKDYPFQLGLQLGFSMSGSGVMDGGKYTVNMSPDCTGKLELVIPILRNPSTAWQKSSMMRR